MASFVILSSGDLRVRVLMPNSPRYTRTRFNHSAFLSDVWYKGTRFTQYERSQPGYATTEGCGLCCQYNAPGIERDSQTGELFLKPGVGVLKREPYEISNLHTPRYEPLPTRVDFASDSARFETYSPNVNGYAYVETREVMLSDNEITERVTLINAGEKAFEMEEYAHNFISLGDEDVNAEYRLNVPAYISPESLSDGALMGVQGGFCLKDEPERAFYVKSTDTRFAPMTWEMTHETSAARAYEKDSFKPCQIAVWGDYYVLSCEVFLAISLAPGETMHWSRTWGFDA